MFLAGGGEGSGISSFVKNLTLLKYLIEKKIKSMEAR